MCGEEGRDRGKKEVRQEDRRREKREDRKYRESGNPGGKERKLRMI